MKILYQGYFYQNEKVAMENAKIEYLKHFKISNNFIFYLHSVSDNDSQKLNFHYFNKNLPADVITVPLYRNLKEINKLDKKENEILGDLFLNRNLIKENAFKYKKTLVEEFQLVLIHGLLHLVGFSHKEEDKLKKIENQILKKVWVNVR
ncbi:MAG: rRNA maturation RNase YbeY [Candidatus Actinomarina sp.]|nr:rRNA maturation RNase YbeY [Candidatus Actinomarina sp.]MBL6762604.1 rRNA maturation RNase YbeY [Candidatus Actinomarina sp.]